MCGLRGWGSQTRTASASSHRQDKNWKECWCKSIESSCSFHPTSETGEQIILGKVRRGGKVGVVQRGLARGARFINSAYHFITVRGPLRLI